ncbi:MAG: DUF1003 domain-containing protein [Phycisphaerae bacterium]|nr:DUF1003 domain-containing protein [Phycisphaerae bacterium]
MTRSTHDVADRLLHKGFDSLTRAEQAVIHRFIERRHVSRDVHAEHEERLTLGQRLADRVASFGGSWTFIVIFGVFLFSWVLLNSLILLREADAFDPYPYILLNLALSMLAAIQAPIIMMSQNRQNAKDREQAQHDYEVNLKAELEIMALHEKMDTLREKQWEALVSMEQEQIQMLAHLVEELKGMSGQQSQREAGGERA